MTNMFIVINQPDQIVQKIGTVWFELCRHCKFCTPLLSQLSQLYNVVIICKVNVLHSAFTILLVNRV